MARPKKTAKELAEREYELTQELEKIKSDQIDFSAHLPKANLDTKKKILLGAFLLENISTKDNFWDSIKEPFSKFLTRDSDRKIFGFAPLTTKGATPKKPKAKGICPKCKNKTLKNRISPTNGLKYEVCEDAGCGYRKEISKSDNGDKTDGGSGK